MSSFLELADVCRFLSDLFSAWGYELATFTDLYHDHWVLCNVCTRIASPGGVFCYNVSFALERMALLFIELQPLIERVAALEQAVFPKYPDVYLPLVTNTELPIDSELWLEELIEGVRRLPG